VHFLDYCQNGQLGCIIVHRDLKPANILLRLDDSIAVSDFGVCHIIKLSAAGEGSAQQVEEQQQLPNAPAAAWPGPAAVAAAAAAPLYTNIGTPFYAAPDVYGTGAAAASSGGSDGGDSSSSSKRSYDASVDVFALGVVVVEMLLGSLAGVCGSGAPRSVAQAEQWEQRLGMLVDGELQLPEGVVVSAAARQFISCCCGGGKERAAAAARGEAKRLTPAQLKQTAWMQQQQ
jgi:serine/threonine protein kinase